MNEIQVVLEARSQEVVVRAWQWPDPKEVLRASLSASPSHPRAALELLEAVARWQGRPVHAAAVAGGRDGCCLLRVFPDFIEPAPTALVQVSFVDRRPARAGVLVREPAPAVQGPEEPVALVGGRR